MTQITNNKHNNKILT